MQTASTKYAVFLKDKKGAEYAIDAPEKFLSEKSIERRLHFNIPVDSSDLPLSKVYLDSITDAGFHCGLQLKWLNAVMVQVDDNVDINVLMNFSFVSGFELLLKDENLQLKSAKNKFINEKGEIDEGVPFSEQQSRLKNDFFASVNIDGSGVAVGLLDAGFYNVKDAPFFDNSKIRETRNIPEFGKSVFSQHTHGSSVLSFMSGGLNGERAPASGAEYVLVRTEVASYEYLIEEFFYAAGLEYLDSIGVDVVNSSLGYSEFDDSTQNHSWSDMDGETTIVSRAAKLAWEKGMFLVVSAGNEGDSFWQHITAPADVPELMSVGGINRFDEPSTFTSAGFDSSITIKPDVVAFASAVEYYPGSGSETGFGDGTSFSAPQISAGVTCMRQAFPNASNDEIKKAIILSCDQYYRANVYTGYGVPNFERAYRHLLSYEQDGDRLVIYPSPAKNFVYIMIDGMMARNSSISIFSLAGERIWHTMYTELGTIDYLKIALSEYPFANGLYYVRLDNKNGSWFGRFSVSK